MSNLQGICDLPITFDEEESQLRFNQDDVRSSKQRVSIEDLAHTLLNRTINYPEKVYSEYQIGGETEPENELKYDLLEIPPGLLGIEFIRSNVFYSPVCNSSGAMKFSCLAEGIKGRVTVIMQRNTASTSKFVNIPDVQEGIMIDLNPGDKIAIPQGYFYTFINSTEETVICSRLYHQYEVACSKSLEATKGLAYFCIRKNAKKEIVFNPRFRSVPNIRRMQPQDNHLPELGLDLQESLYTMRRIKTDKLRSLFF